MTDSKSWFWIIWDIILMIFSKIRGDKNNQEIIDQQKKEQEKKDQENINNELKKKEEKNIEDSHKNEGGDISDIQDSLNDKFK